MEVLCNVAENGGNRQKTCASGYKEQGCEHSISHIHLKQSNIWLQVSANVGYLKQKMHVHPHIFLISRLCPKPLISSYLKPKLLM